MIRDPRALSRRAWLRSLGSLALALPFVNLAERRASEAATGFAKRLFVLYFPDGVPGQSQDGEPSLWHATGGASPVLPAAVSPLEARKGDCVFFRGLSMGPTDSGSHPGGAKKLLTAVDQGGGASIDQHLAKTIGASSPWQHLYLGAQATLQGASGDKFISYPTAGQTIAPEDDPRKAFSLLFPGGQQTGGGGSGDPVGASVIDSVLSDLDRVKARLGGVEATKLDLHVEAAREVEKSIKGTGTPPAAGCVPVLSTDGITDATLSTPEAFPALLKAQLDLAVLAGACEMTRVVTVQASNHTSELLMSRFEGTEMYDPTFDMRSHQASHYGASHDFSKKEFDAFVKHGRWWSSQLLYLLDRLASLPEPGEDGTMLDHSLVLFCTEVCDGNTHLHDDMPFVVAGRGGGKVSTGRVFEANGTRHGALLAALGNAMGADLASFGDGAAPLSLG